MDTSSTSHPSSGSLAVAWLAVRDLVSWFTRLIMPTSQDLREAGVYLENWPGRFSIASERRVDARQAQDDRRTPGLNNH